MNITLRKANALQTSIMDALKSVDVKTTVELNEFENAQNALSLANQALIEADMRRATLSKVFYDIRTLVSQANSTTGISDRLSECAYLDKRIGQLGSLIGSEAQDSPAVVNGKLDKIRNRKEEVSRHHMLYGNADIVTTGVLTQGQIDTYRDTQRDLKKQKQKINDEILELNVRTDITLSESTVAVLQKEGLI
jgi:hypothetical protein